MATASYYDAIGLLAICDAIESVEGIPLTSYASLEPPKSQLPASLRSTDKINGTKDSEKGATESRYGAPYPYPPPAPPGFTDKTGIIQHPYLSPPGNGQLMVPGSQTLAPNYGYQGYQQAYSGAYNSPGYGTSVGNAGVSSFPAPGTPGRGPNAIGQVSTYPQNVPIMGVSSSNTTPLRPGMIPSNGSTPVRLDSMQSDTNGTYRSEDCPICGRNFKGPKASTHKQQHIRRLHPEDYTPKRGGKKRIMLDESSSIGSVSDGGSQFPSLAQTASNPY